MLIKQNPIYIVLFCMIVYVEASLRNKRPEDVNVKKQSSNQLPSDLQQKSETEQLYYLPLQTEYGETNVLAAAGGQTTSPPQLIIKPAPIQTDYYGSSTSFHEDFSFESNYYKAPLENQCVSETPVNELESHFLIPSSDVSKESVVMSGHLEIASKTSSVEEVSEIHNFVSQPSIALQGTMLHPYTVSDL